MASGLVRCALSGVIDDQRLQISTERIVKLQVFGKIILEKITQGDSAVACFDAFSSKLTASLKSTFDCASSCLSFSTKRCRVWTAFHQQRIDILPEIWDELFVAMELQCDDQLLPQSVNEELFKMLLSEQFSPQQSSETAAEIGELSMSKDELNALRYAGGYVPHVLLKRFEKRVGQKYDQFVECLGELAVSSGQEDFLEYTREWMEKVNRGGLFPLNNTTFSLFVSIEKRVKILLPAHAVKGPSSEEQFKTDVIDKIVQDDDVQWY